MTNGTSLPALGLLGEHQEMSPSRYEIMRQNLQKDRDIFSEPATPTGGRTSSLSLALQKSQGARALARSSSRHMSTSSRRGSFMSNHRQKMSSEHFAQAEKSFMSLMDLMTGASKEAGSLREYWSRLISDREAFDKERESLVVQIDEMTASMERMEIEQESQRQHVGDRKQEVARLLNELSIAAATITELRKKLSDRETSTHHEKTEITEIRSSMIRAQNDYEKLQSQFDGAQSRLRTTEEEHTRTREEVEKYRSDYRSVSRELADLKSRNGDLQTSLESSSLEVRTLTERTRSWELEKANLLAEKDRMLYDVRKHSSKADDLSHELNEVNDKYTRLQRELHHTKETLRTTELDRDEQASNVDNFRRELRDKSLELERVEAQHSDISIKLEQETRTVATKDELLMERDSQITSLQQRLNSKSDETRHAIIERDQYRDDLERERQTVNDHRHKVTTLEARLTETETRLTNSRSELSASSERITAIEREREEIRGGQGDLTGEIRTLNEKIFRLQEEIRTITYDRDHLRREVEEFKSKYETVTERIEDWGDDCGELEYEIENLRVLLREAREQREAAVSARVAADSERDRSNSLYEEKCREYERLVESSSRASFSRTHSHSHGHGHGGNRSSSVRIFSRGSTAASHKDGHVDGDAETSFTS
ncbi:hypothetical protein D0865_05438 [Hortaea werneckii]|uniref:Uncharacterized protein n=1 Tax=Hortaea werneckii TaxID=91943 RepID=A0A3M7CN44_HORWE|nr:hypothetical protein D0865_05438 [Hortaea werneckii]